MVRNVCLKTLTAEHNKHAIVELQDLTAIRDQLKNECKSESVAISSLLHWLRSGSGEWSIFPMYEIFPEQLLIGFSKDKIISALELEVPSFQHLEGAARLFASVAFHDKKPDSEANLAMALTRLDLIIAPPQPRLAEIPQEWREKLLNHCLQSDDEEKIRRAKIAFNPAFSPDKPE